MLNTFRNPTEALSKHKTPEIKQTKTFKCEPHGVLSLLFDIRA